MIPNAAIGPIPWEDPDARNVSVGVADALAVALTDAGIAVTVIRFKAEADAIARSNADRPIAIAVVPATDAFARIEAEEEISRRPCEASIPRGRGDADAENLSSESSEGINAALPRIANEGPRPVRFDAATGEGMGWTIRRLIRNIR